MSLYYPQAAIVLGVIWEDFDNEEEKFLQEVYSLPILARSTSVEINDYREADAFTAEIDYKAFPFDPRTIRACRITIHMEDREKVFDGNVLNKIKPSTENTVFVGYVDEESITYNDRDRTVRMEGRDLTSLFIDAKYLGSPISLSKPLDQVLTDLFKYQVATENMKLENRTGEVLPVISAQGIEARIHGAFICDSRLCGFFSQGFNADDPLKTPPQSLFRPCRTFQILSDAAKHPCARAGAMQKCFLKTKAF